MRPISRPAFPPALAMLVVLPACAVPARDNARDPSIAPAAALEVVDLAPCGGAPEPETGWPPVGASSRSRCLALDARGSRDPQGRTMRFSYWVLGTAGAPVGEALAEDVPGLDFLPLGEAVRRSLRAGGLQGFRVRVEDSDGARDESDASIAIVNARPRAIAPPVRVLPEGGFPWDFGGDLVVRLVGDGEDADGDPRSWWSWCWTDDPTAPGCPLSTGSALDLVLPASRGRTTVYLSVGDGAARSSPAGAELRVQEPAVWVHGVGQQGFAYRLDTERSDVQMPADSAGGAILLPALGNVPARAVVWAGESSFPAPGVVRLLDARGAFVDGDVTWDATGFSYDFPRGMHAVPAPDGSARVWIASEPNGGVQAPARLRAFDVNAARTALSATSIEVELGSGAFHEMAHDTQGRLWITDGEALAARDAGGAAIASALPPSGSYFAGLGASPTGGVWALLGDDPATGGVERTSLVRVSLEGTPAAIAFEEVATGVDAARWIAWIDEERFWTVFRDHGLSLVDTARFGMVTDLEAAAVVSHPEIRSASFPLVVDLPSGRVGGFSFSGHGFLARPDGRAETVPDALWHPLAFGDDGLVWAYDRASANLVSRREALGTRAASVGLNGEVVLDAFTGGVALLHDDGVGTSLLRFGADGTFLETVTGLEVDAVLTPFPRTVHTSAFARDGGSLWVVATPDSGSDPLQVFRVDLDAPRTSDVQVPAVLVDADLDEPGLTASGISGRAASRAEGPGGSFLWLAGDTGSSRIVGQVADVTPTWTQHFATGEQSIQIAHWASDNSLCVVTKSGSDVRFRRVQADGTVSLLGTLAGAASTAGHFPAGAAATERNGVKLCWANIANANADDVRLVGINLAGAVIHDRTETDGIGGPLYVTDADHAFVAMLQDLGTVDYFTMEIDFTTGIRTTHAEDASVVVVP